MNRCVKVVVWNKQNLQLLNQRRSEYQNFLQTEPETIDHSGLICESYQELLFIGIFFLSSSWTEDVLKYC